MAPKIKKIVQFCLALGFLVFSSVGGAEPDPGVPPRLLWSHSPIQPPRGVVVVGHGLNLKPIKMTPILQTLNDAGYDVLGVSLSGHLGNEAEFKSVTRELWVGEMRAAYFEAKAASDAHQLPLYFVGYSISGLLNLDLLNSEPEHKIQYDRMVLLAPAAALNFTSYFVKIFRIFGKDFVVPSFANPDYRANAAGTPMAAYDALFDSVSHIESKGVAQRETPTLVIMDPEDELVSVSGIRDLMRKNQLNDWRMMSVSNGHSRMENGKYHHLIIDEQSLGESEWKRVQDAMLLHLGKATDVDHI